MALQQLPTRFKKGQMARKSFDTGQKRRTDIIITDITFSFDFSIKISHKICRQKLMAIINGFSRFNGVLMENEYINIFLLF